MSCILYSVSFSLISSMYIIMYTRQGVIQDFEVEGGNNSAKKMSTVISIPCYSM